VPEYRLAPEHPFPAAIEDALRAYVWMLDSGTRPDRVTLAGDSSGGGLALSLLIRLTQEGLPHPRGAVLLSPGIDLTFEQLDDPPDGQASLSVEQMRSFAASYLGGHPADDPLVSPLHADLTGLPPLLVQGGTGDLVVVDAHRLAARARDQGVDVHLELYPADTHDFQVFWSFLPEAADALKQAGRFAREVATGPEAHRASS